MLLINTGAHVSARASHFKIMFPCISCAMQMSYKGVGCTPGIIILISFILSYIQNSITTRGIGFELIRQDEESVLQRV